MWGAERDELLDLVAHIQRAETLQHRPRQDAAERVRDDRHSLPAGTGVNQVDRRCEFIGDVFEPGVRIPTKLERNHPAGVEFLQAQRELSPIAGATVSGVIVSPNFHVPRTWLEAVDKKNRNCVSFRRDPQPLLSRGT